MNLLIRHDVNHEMSKSSAAKMVDLRTAIKEIVKSKRNLMLRDIENTTARVVHPQLKTVIPKTKTSKKTIDIALGTLSP